MARKILAVKFIETEQVRAERVMIAIFVHNLAIV